MVMRHRCCTATLPHRLHSCQLPAASPTAPSPRPSSLSLWLPQGEQREVSTAQGVAFARAHGCLYVETSAKGNVAVEQAFEELVHKVGLGGGGRWRREGGAALQVPGSVLAACCGLGGEESRCHRLLPPGSLPAAAASR